MYSELKGAYERIADAENAKQIFILGENYEAYFFRY